MNRTETAATPRIFFPAFLSLLIILAGCAGVSHEAYYEGPLGTNTAGMVPVKDDAKKFDFMVPAGWSEVPADQALPEELEVPRNFISEYGGTATFRKGDRGSLVVWCQRYEDTDYEIEHALYNISASAVLVEGPLQIPSKGWNPVFRQYDSSIIEAGEKKGFSFLFGTKSQATLSLFNCNYAVVARSSSLENTEEIKDDFIAVLRSLKN